MLQRIYGIAFARREELEEHLAKLEAARARDHRRLGAELDCSSSTSGRRAHPSTAKGLRLYNALVEYMRGLYRRYGYQEVMCPRCSRRALQDLGSLGQLPGRHVRGTGEGEAEVHGLKPMNCPGHCLMFRSRKRSYRELPCASRSFSRLHRNERSERCTA